MFINAPEQNPLLPETNIIELFRWFSQALPSVQFTFMLQFPELPKAFEKFAKRRWNWQIDIEQFRLATDVGVAGVEVMRVFTKPGDRILINSLVYQNLYNWIN